MTVSEWIQRMIKDKDRGMRYLTGIVKIKTQGMGKVPALGLVLVLAPIQTWAMARSWA